MQRRYTTTDLQKVLKRKDAWWTVLVIDKIAIPLTLFFANYMPFLSPNIFTLLSLILSLTAAYSFFHGHMVQGALLYELSFLFDCIDGKLAALTNRQSLVGLWLDKISDKFRLFFNTVALTFPHYALIGIIFLFMYLWDEVDAVSYENIALKNNKDKYSNVNKTSGFTGFLLKRRLALLPSAVEMDTMAFFVGPLLSVKWGFIAGILIAIVRKLAIHYHFKLGNALK